MKTFDLSAAAATAAVSKSPEFATASVSGADSSREFSEVMGQALALNDSDHGEESSNDSNLDAGLDQHPGGDPMQPLSSAELLAALILPAIASVQATSTGSKATGIEDGSPTAGTLSQATVAVAFQASSESTLLAGSNQMSASSAAAAHAGQLEVPQATLPAPTSATAGGVPTEKQTPDVPLAESLQATVAVPPALKPASEASFSQPYAAPIGSHATQAETNIRPEPSPVNATPVNDPAAVSAQHELPDETVETDATRVVAPSEVNVQSASAASVPPRGTSGAKYVSPMQKAEKVNDLAGSTEQKLPGAEVTPVGEASFIKASRSTPAPSASEKSDAAPAIGSSTPDSVAAKEVSSKTDLIPTASPLRSVERAHDLMALHAVRLRDSGRDSMQVVIKPSPDLHIALNLQMRDGAIEVNAQLQRGDYEFLNRHWSDLQQQMEARGVRLAPLNSANPSLSGNGNFSQHSGQHSSEEKAAKTGAFAEFALAGVLVPKRSNKTTVSRGWESWA